MRLARAVTSLAAGYFIFPASYFRKLRVRGVREGFELIFVTVFAGLAAYVVCSVVTCRFGLGRLKGLGSCAGAEPGKGDSQQPAKERELDDSVGSQLHTSLCDRRQSNPEPTYVKARVFVLCALFIFKVLPH